MLHNGTLPNGDVPIYGLNGQGAAILTTAGRKQPMTSTVGLAQL